MSNPAETYEQKMVPIVFAPCVPWLMEAAPPQPGERVLDLACGTGIVAREAARRVGESGQVVGCDLNPAMLAVARACAEREGLRIEWHEGRAEALSFGDGSFDLLFCQHGLQFVPEKLQALAEMRRVLREDGRLALSVWRGLDHHPFIAGFNEVITRHLGVPALAAPFSLGNAGELRTLLTEAGFQEVEIAPHSITARFPNPEGFVRMQMDVVGAAIPSAQHLDWEARERLAAAMGAEMTGPIQDATRDQQLVIPFHGYVASVRR